VTDVTRTNGYVTGAERAYFSVMSESALVSLLHKIPLFAELPDEALSELARRCVSRPVLAGHVLFTTGEECRGLYMIESGRVRIYRTDESGREQVLHVEGPGRPVAELPLFDGGPYPASAVTTEDSRLVFLPRADFEYLYRHQPDIAQAIIRALGRRLRHLVHVTETLAFRDVAARLAMLLLGYAERVGTRTPDGVEVELDRTQEEIAHEIGTARESVSRAMKQLRRHGMIKPLERNRILIPDVARLRTVAF
jgi:cAMP-binding proteins - catabolite gene activator and regulatory subunit of cAMP-dependent protein kinases